MTEKGSELRVVRQGRDGRRRYEESARRALVERALRPGISVARLAQGHGINANLLRKWITKYLMQREVSGGQEALTVDAAEIVAVNGPARELARSSSTAFVPGIAEPPMSVAEFTGEEPRPVAAMAAAPHVRLPNGVEFDRMRSISDAPQFR
ncbi:transposase [Burkholderia seminalis]|uniref:transposase n=1 Tax=Burkholderia seminalis TaxID=488731 RepID=UPI00264CA1F6|nr:transposase [Burkholderia seminalis]MDN7586835.1 transposase [Burkholderia seminalis]